MADLTFYTNPQSRGRIVRWMLEEVGEPYDTEIVTYDRMKDAAYLAVNPMGKVPAIRHKGKIVTECAAICAYLADVYVGSAVMWGTQFGTMPQRGSFAAYVERIKGREGFLRAGQKDDEAQTQIQPAQPQPA